MMSLLLGDSPGPVDEFEPFPKIRETEDSEEMVVVRRFPFGDFGEQFLDSVALKWRDTAPARHACLIG
jgi:hypothetical protein